MRFPYDNEFINKLFVLWTSYGRICTCFIFTFYNMCFNIGFMNFYVGINVYAYYSLIKLLDIAFSNFLSISS